MLKHIALFVIVMGAFAPQAGAVTGMCHKAACPVIKHVPKKSTATAEQYSGATASTDKMRLRPVTRRPASR